MEFGDSLCCYDGFGCVLFSGTRWYFGCVLSQFRGFKSPRCLVLYCSVVVLLCRALILPGRCGHQRLRMLVSS